VGGLVREIGADAHGMTSANVPGKGATHGRMD
jgi:hypothetical protein